MSEGDRFSFPNAAKLLFTRIDNRTLSGRYTSNAETMYNLVAPHMPSISLTLPTMPVLFLPKPAPNDAERPKATILRGPGCLMTTHKQCKKKEKRVRVRSTNRWIEWHWGDRWCGKKRRKKKKTRNELAWPWAQEKIMLRNDERHAYICRDIIEWYWKLMREACQKYEKSRNGWRWMIMTI